MTIREALLMMGYNEQESGHWIKPIAFVCLTYHEEKNEWANWFLAHEPKEIMCWEKKQFNIPGDYLSQLKNFEYGTRLDMYIDGDSHFELQRIYDI